MARSYRLHTMTHQFSSVLMVKMIHKHKCWLCCTRDNDIKSNLDYLKDKQYTYLQTHIFRRCLKCNSILRNTYSGRRHSSLKAKYQHILGLALQFSPMSRTLWSPAQQMLQLAPAVSLNGISYLQGTHVGRCFISRQKKREKEKEQNGNLRTQHHNESEYNQTNKFISTCKQRSLLT